MAIFAPTLNITLIYDFFESCRLSICKSAVIVHFPAEPMFSRPFCHYRCWAPLWIQNFSKNFWRAARAREIMSPRKTSIFFECCKKLPQQKNFFAEMWTMAKKKYLDCQIFCKTFLPTRIWYYVKKKGPRWCQHARILQYFMFMLLYVLQSFFEIWRWLIYMERHLFLMEDAMK